ncbi:MAG: glutamate 5-kinase, partial [Candidatus Omnitrophota bacterium]
MVKMIVIKIGSSLLSRDNRLDNEMLKNITRQACILRNRGIDIILVSSGAVSSGMATLGLNARPNKIANLQACASLGQGMLMKSYIAAFAEKNLRCAQLLLTSEDFSDRKRYLNVRHTIFSLFKYNALPVVNENDTVSTEEIKFGDNDNLSALVAILVRADLLIILSDVAGLLDDKKRLVSQVAKITRQIRKFACPTKNGICRGGMISKISAAEKVTAAAIP